MPSEQHIAPPPAWGAVPVFPVVLVFIAGIFIADKTGFTPPTYWLVVAGIIGLILILLHLRPSPQRWKSILSSGLILSLLFVLAGWRTNTVHLPGQETYFINHYTNGDLLAGKVKAIKPGEKRMRAEVNLSHIIPDSLEAKAITGSLLVYLQPDEKTAGLKAGDKIVFKGQVRELRPPLNPFVFDLRKYWQGQGIFHNVFLREAADWEKTDGGHSGLKARAEGWRRAWFKTFQDHLSGDQLAVASALVMGKRDLISQEVKSAYTDTGAIHVLAVSGLHVGIIFLILRFFLVTLLKLDRTKAGRIIVALISILCIWAFALVSGLSPSVQRAAIMFTILAAGGATKRKSFIFNTLSAAALVMLWLDPGQLFQVGFQLSFTAIIGIVLFTSYLSRLWYFPTKVLRWFWSAMSASTGAQLGTLPLSLYNFGQFPTYFLISGTVVIISAFATMFAGLFHGLVAGLSGNSVAAEGTGWFLGSVVRLQNAFIFLFDGLPGGLLKVPVFPWWLALLLAGGIGLLAAWVRWRKSWTGIVGMLLFGAVIWGARTQVQGEVEGAKTVLYHVSSGTLLDVPSQGDHPVAFGHEPSANNLAWSAGPNRERRQYQPAITLPFSAADTVLSPTLALQKPFLRLGNMTWLILDGQSPIAEVPDLSAVTHVLITNKLKLKQLPEFPAGTKPLLLVDGSNPFYRYAQWRDKAEELGLDIWVTGEDGAWLEPGE